MFCWYSDFSPVSILFLYLYGRAVSCSPPWLSSTVDSRLPAEFPAAFEYFFCVAHSRHPLKDDLFEASMFPRQREPQLIGYCHSHPVSHTRFPPFLVNPHLRPFLVRLIRPPFVVSFSSLSWLFRNTLARKDIPGTLDILLRKTVAPRNVRVA